MFAQFQLAAKPAKGRKLAIVWRLGAFRTTVLASRPESTLVTGQIGSLSSGHILPGRWSATLVAGGKPVAVARVRVAAS